MTDWQLCSTPSGEVTQPSQLRDLSWQPARSTVADSLRAAGSWSLDAPARRFDDRDWWFRARLPKLPAAPPDEVALCLDGLASVATVWHNGAPIVESANMFHAHELTLAGDGDDEVHIRFHALDPLLAQKRPRPRWRAPMVENQQLRWFRTTLLGRTPGWSPPAAAVGPWRPVRLEWRRELAVDDVQLRSHVSGTVEVSCKLRSLGAPVETVELIVERNGVEQRAPLALTGGIFAGRVEIARPERWWPHTHGEPALYRARLQVGDITVELGAIGFREVVREGEFSLRVNGVPVFCRGACWTPLDVVTLGGERATYQAALTQARDCGMNLLRVGGTMVYESDDFYDLCDELGVLVWQDLMFANMDYPEDDAAFAENVNEEVRQIAARLQARPSLAVLCGNSEGEQQAAMWGASRERWSPKLFHHTLAELSRELCPDVPYWPSSAHGGAFPHQSDRGTSSYYGVGAYLRPLDDARRAEVRFASECLAFANLPRALTTKVHSPAWKARTPRDLGAGWDFDDVRDHYLGTLFRVDPPSLRYADHDRYVELGRAVTGEVMAQVFGEWRRKRSTCAGGLVWFLRDLWAGAGWGVVDAAGAPKAAWWYLKRALAPISAHISDEGGNGLHLHVYNDRPAPLSAELELTLHRAGEVAVGGARRALDIPAHDALELPAAELFEGFLDLSYAYRFGPASQDLIVATLRDSRGILSQAFHFPLGLPNTRELDLGLTAQARATDGGAELTVRTRRFAQTVALELDGYSAEDDYFHLPPGAERTLQLRGSAPLRGSVRALNCEQSSKITVGAAS